MDGNTTYAMRVAGLLGFALFALGLGASSLTSPWVAGALASLPMIGLALCFPVPFLVAAIALLPFSNDLTGGRLTGLQVGASDGLLALGFLGVAARLLARHAIASSARPLRPLLVPLSLYLCGLAVAVAFHPSVEGVATLVQRLELVVLALLAGVFLAQQKSLDRALGLFVLVAGVLAVAATLATLIRGTEVGGFLGVQKNPAGQAIAGALLVLVGNRSFPVRPIMAGALAVGLLASLSRGAVVAAAVGLLVLATLQSRGQRLRLIGLAAGVGALVVLAFNSLPGEQQERLVRVSPGTDYAAGERFRYADDAWATFQSAPYLGVGPGNYAGGEQAPGIADPHNVLLLEAVDGGVVLAGAFLLLAVGSLFVLARRVRRHPIVVTALAVQLATLLHGMVDVYWVRGTPVLGWVLVGAALTLAHRDQTSSVGARGQEAEARWR